MRKDSDISLILKDVVEKKLPPIEQAKVMFDIENFRRYFLREAPLLECLNQQFSAGKIDRKTALTRWREFFLNECPDGHSEIRELYCFECRVVREKRENIKTVYDKVKEVLNTTLKFGLSVGTTQAASVGTTQAAVDESKTVKNVGICRAVINKMFRSGSSQASSSISVSMIKEALWTAGLLTGAYHIGATGYHVVQWEMAAREMRYAIEIACKELKKKENEELSLIDLQFCRLTSSYGFIDYLLKSLSPNLGLKMP
jgi:hypothetical protein